MNDRQSPTTDYSLDGTPFRLVPLLTGREGYSYWLEMGNRSVLVDCGRDWDALSIRLPKQPDAAIISHAHRNVVGGLLGFSFAFPDCPVYATTITFSSLAVEDSAGFNWVALAFRQSTSLGDSLFLTFEPAGHLPGAAVTILTVTTDSQGLPKADTDTDGQRSPNETLSAGHTCIVTSDCALTASRFQPSLPLAQLRQWQPEVLAVSGALGAEKWPTRKAAEAGLIEHFQEAIAANHTVLLPLPDMGIAQELLFAISTNSRFRQVPSKLMVWLDAAIAAGCERYRVLLPHLPRAVRNYARDRPLFIQESKQLSIALLPEEDRERQKALQSPSLVFCHACASAEEWAAIWHHLSPKRTRYLRLPEVELAIPIEQWPSDLAAGMQVIDGAWHSLSDRNSLKQIVHTLKPQHLIFTHGKEGSLKALAQLPEFRDRYLTYAPQDGDEIALNLAAIEAANPLGVTAAEPVAYEGEVEETICIHTGKIEGVEVRLPPEIMDDPRWDALSETGLVTARWDGDLLVLRGLSSRALQREAASYGATAQRGERGSGECSGCAYYARVRSTPNTKPQCTQPRSPLYGVTVSPQGSCPDFKPADR